MKKKDAFSKVEADAKKKLKDPQFRGAAGAVLKYIEEQRKKKPSTSLPSKGGI